MCQRIKDLHGLASFINRVLELLKRAKICHDIGADIKRIKRRVNEVSKRRVRYKVNSSVASRSVGQTVLAAHQVQMRKLQVIWATSTVGREGDVELEWLIRA